MSQSLLLDTNAFLWWRADDARLSSEARKAIAKADVVFVIAASACEVAVKMALGRIRLPSTFESEVEDSAFETLATTMLHAEKAGSLQDHHRDPFDRLLVAQARLEGLTLVTHDRRLAAYQAQFLWT